MGSALGEVGGEEGMGGCGVGVVVAGAGVTFSRILCATPLASNSRALHWLYIKKHIREFALAVQSPSGSPAVTWRHGPDQASMIWIPASVIFGRLVLRSLRIRYR